MKKILCIFVTLFLTLSLSACGNQKEAGNGDVCYVTIDCHTAVSSAELSGDIRELQPENGMVLEKYAVGITEGMNAMEAFEATCKANKLQFEYATMSGMKYVDGINNLYSYDCGDLSGWYSLYNGESPSVGMSEIRVEKDAELLLIYSCDMGSDIGASM